MTMKINHDDCDIFTIMMECTMKSILYLKDKCVERDKKIEELERKLAKAGNDDSFYGKLFMSEKHVRIMEDHFANHERTPVDFSLIEEMSELTHAILRFNRNHMRCMVANDYDEDEAIESLTLRENVVEEMAHVLISLKATADIYEIDPEDIQAYFYKKCPEGYEKKGGNNENK